MAFRKKKQLQEAFLAVQYELDEHLEGINCNTEEIFENRVLLLEMEQKLLRLSEKVHELGLQMKQHQFTYPSIELTTRQQEVFLVMYTATDVVSYDVISTVTALPVSSVQEQVYELIRAGVPVIKQRDDRGEIFLTLDIEFKEQQSVHNIVGIDSNISKRLNKQLQLSSFD